MNKLIISALLPVIGILSVAGQETAGKFFVRIKGDIGLTDSYSTEYNFPVNDETNGMHNFGLELGWSFWQSGRHSLQLGLGIGLQKVNLTAATDGVSYSYSAPSSADMDGNTYIRYTDLSAMKQSLGLSRISVPMFLQYNYKFNPRWSIYGKAGVMVGFGGKVKLNKIEGSVYSYGVYPEYGDLVMDDSWINEFGERTLTKDQAVSASSVSTDFGILTGVGLSFQVIKPLAISLGLTYQAGFSDMLKGDGLKIANGQLNEAQVPVTYTVSEGIRYSPLTDGLTKCRLNRLGLELGVEFRF